jgi:hypothetical protein|tara:strand:- start:8039 stop:10060 length:2022 start_codon:yes stop_codon:yes gene_type:complete
MGDVRSLLGRDSENYQKTEVKTAPVDGDLSIGEKLRLVGAGASWNFSDELFASVKSIASRLTGGELTFEQAVAEERKIIEDARKKDPMAAMGYELGGASLVTLATMPFTFGGSAAPGLARMALIGGGHATTAALGARKGDPVERVTKDPGDLIKAGTTGAVLGPVIGRGAPAVAKVVGKAVVAPINFLRTKFGGKLPTQVEAELSRLLNEGGISPEEMIRRISAGEIFPDMSPEAAIALRAVYNKMSTGRGVVSEALIRRSKILAEKGSAALQADLVPIAPSGNVVKAMNQTIEAMKKAESSSYNKIFKETVPQPSNNLNLGVLEVAGNNPTIIKDLNQLIAARNLPPLFRKKLDAAGQETGEIALTRNVSLEDGEIVRRALKDITEESYRKGKGGLGEAFGDLEKKLRIMLDGLSPALKSTRANYAKMFAARTAFDEGRKIFSKIPDDAEIIFERIVKSGDLDVISAFRAGAGASLRGKATKSAKATLFRNLNDISRSERLILEKIYPEESLEVAVRKIQLAHQAIRSEGKVLQGTVTQTTQEASKRIGVSGQLANLSALMGGDLMAGTRIVKNWIGKKADNLTDNDLAQIGKILVSENPTLVRRALFQPAMLAGAKKRTNQIADVFIKTATGTATRTAGTDFEKAKQGQRTSVQSIIDGMSSSTKKKLVNQ